MLTLPICRQMSFINFIKQIEIVSASLKDDPGNAELLSLKDELDQMIKLLDDSLAELKPAQEPTKPAAKATPTPPPPAEEKWSRENHPAYKKAAAAAAPVEEKEPEVAVVYQVNDNVTAKWLSGDRGFYPARITSVTGSSTNPIYTVKFKSYDTVETLRAKDIRPTAQKRKADGSVAPGNNSSAVPVTYSPTTTGAGASASPSGTPGHPASSATGGGGSSGVVLSAAASLYPQAQQANKGGDQAGEEKPAKKFKKIKATKELEAGKSKWQEFNAKGKLGKSKKKDSMFRTPDGVHGRGTFFF